MHSVVPATTALLAVVSLATLAFNSAQSHMRPEGASVRLTKQAPVGRENGELCLVVENGGREEALLTDATFQLEVPDSPGPVRVAATISSLTRGRVAAGSVQSVTVTRKDNLEEAGELFNSIHDGLKWLRDDSEELQAACPAPPCPYVFTCRVFSIAGSSLCRLAVTRQEFKQLVGFPSDLPLLTDE